jgi:hypothetical protein
MENGVFAKKRGQLMKEAGVHGSGSRCPHLAL